MTKKSARLAETLNIRIPTHETELLERYAQVTRRTKSDIVRELIRSLEPELERLLERRRKDLKP
jgi:predicted DNA-binding protein